MAVSVPDSLSQIPGFRDRLGERVIVPQPSGSLLEYLHFCDALATAPFFDQGMKDRLAKLSNFTHSSYCRVRRLQRLAERDGRPALVSVHVAGRRLAEILEVASRTSVRPTTAAVLAVTRQMMASVALLHDFAPYGFHGTLGPDRVILCGEGRIVIAEHVLGGLAEQAAAAWGVSRLWREFRLPVLPEPGSSQYGRRTDIVQVGLVTLAMLLGRPLSDDDYPDGLTPLVDEATETTPDGAHVPLRAGLRGWLERALALRADAAFRTLVECQKAFGALLQDGGYGASMVAWDAFVGVCETAAVRVPVVVVVPEPSPAEPAAPTVLAADAILPAVAVEPAAGGVEAVPELLPVVLPDAAVAPADGPHPPVDPFEPWPVDEPAHSAATLLDSLPPGSTAAAPVRAADVLGDLVEPGPPPALTPDMWAPPPPEEALFASEPTPERLFEAAPVAPPEPPPPQPAPAAGLPQMAAQFSGSSAKPTSMSVTDWQGTDQQAAFQWSDEEAQQEAWPAAESEQPAAVDGSRRTKLAILIGTVTLAVVAAVFAPYGWRVVFDGRGSMGTVVLDSDPPGATVTADGQVRGHTPLTMKLTAGPHELELQVGGSASKKTVTVAAKRTLTEKFTFPEAGARGGLMITTAPLKGRVSIDGGLRGDAPVRVTDLQPGTHTLMVETPLGVQEQDVVVQPGRVSQLSVPTASWLKVNAPYELKILEDNRLLGTTAKGPVMVPPGRHTFDFQNQAVGLKMRQFVDAPAGQTITVPLDLPTGMINLSADQPADVYVDGEKVGQTPLVSFQVPLGSHEVVFRHPKYGEVRYTVAVTLAAPVNLNVTFQK